MKFGLKHFKAPTPAKMKKLGNALMATFGTGAVGSFGSGHPYIAYAFGALALLGKFLTSLFTEDSQQ